MTVDIGNLQQVVEAGVLQPVESEALEAAVPANLRSPDDLWFALTERARIVYASKERVAEGEVTTYEDLADPKWQGRICSRSGVHNYSLALLSAVIAHHGEEYARTWAEGLKANLAVKPQGGDRDQVRSIWAGECDISLGNTYYMGQMLEDPEQQEWAESIYAEENHEYPVVPGSEVSELVAGWGEMTPDTVDLTEVAGHRAAALRIMEEVNFDG
jgi:iron(III) transport system substrate-binding protein